MAKQERKFRRRGFFSFGAFALVMMLLTYLLIAHTPLRQTIPGYPSRETRQAAIENFKLIDSLERVIDLWAFQVANIQRVATGREALPLDSLRLAHTEETPDEALLARYRQGDSLLRQQVEQLDSLQNERAATGRIEALEGIRFTRPLKGTLKENFRRSEGYPLVEVAAAPGTTVAAPLDGRIVAAEWNEVEGCMLRMLHENGLSTIYRHADKLLKSVGEEVKAGTAVAVVGRTDELSDPHILIELRYKNQRIDPALYLEF